MSATTTETLAPQSLVLTRAEPPVFQLSPGTYAVPMSLHAKNRARLVDAVRSSVPAGTIMLFAGGRQLCRNDTDHEELFRQESYFQWLFGVKEADCMGVVEVDTGRAVLFIPRLPDSYAVWMGDILPPAHFVSAYGVDECRFVDELPTFVAAKSPSRVCTLRGVNADSGAEATPATFDGLSAWTEDQSTVFSAIARLRVVKTPEEIDLMRHVNGVASRAHVAVMRAARVGLPEYHLESLFQHESYTHGGHRHMAYTCICGAGVNSSVLHYGHAGAPNSRVIGDGEMLLMDMGGEYHCYGADITCSYPANGKFTPLQRGVYNVVLAAMRRVEATMRPGIAWVDMHRLAFRVIVEGLIELGILGGGSVDEMLAAHMAAVFMPHGLGHSLGIDTHDVGGRPPEIPRIDEPGTRSLRFLRTLEEGVVITVEPGIYFITKLLDAAAANPAQARFLRQEVLALYKGFGGVRLEDNVVVTATGIEVLTNVPRECDDIEAVMAGAPWPRS